MHRDYFKENLDRIRDLLDFIERLRGELSPEEQRRISHPEFFLGAPYKLYYRAPDRNSPEYKVLNKIIGRDTDLLYPQYKGWHSWDKRWYDNDVDRELWGYEYSYLGRQEYKFTYRLDEPFEYPSSSRRYLYNTLTDSFLWLRGSVKNFSSSSTLERGYEDGKGVVLYKFYTGDLQYFSIINFTATNYEELHAPNLKTVANLIQPWASELMNFLVEAWVRRKYEDALEHIMSGIESEEFRFDKEVDEYLISGFDGWLEKFDHHMMIEVIMDEIMEIVNFNTILKEPDRYLEFVDGIRKGKLDLNSPSKFVEKRKKIA